MQFCVLLCANRGHLFSGSFVGFLFVTCLVNQPVCDSKSIAGVSTTAFNSSAPNGSLTQLNFPSEKKPHQLEIPAKFVGIRVLYDRSLVRKTNNDRALAHAQLEFVVNEANRVFHQSLFESKTADLRYERYSHWVVKQELDEYGSMNQPSGHWEMANLVQRLSETEYGRTSANYGLNLFLTDLPIASHSTRHLIQNEFYYGRICGKENWVVASFFVCQHITDSTCIVNLVKQLGLAWIGSSEQQDEWIRKENGRFVVSSLDDASLKPNTVYMSPLARESIAHGIDDGESDPIHVCFLDELKFSPHCGNLVLEQGEQCDDGPDSLCCTTNCTLRPNAQCTPWHNLSCDSQCRIKPRGEQCIAWDPRHCLAKSMSDGLNPDCVKTQVKLPDRSKCTYQTTTGMCFDGHCRALTAQDSTFSEPQHNTKIFICFGICFALVVFLVTICYFSKDKICAGFHKTRSGEPVQMSNWSHVESDSTDTKQLIFTADFKYPQLRQ